jgi:hypothetical protein
MKKALMILGGIFILVIVLLVGGLAILHVQGRALDRESKAYVDAAIPAIVAKWDINEIERRISPEFKATLKDGDLEKVVRFFSKLGKLKEYKGAKGESNIKVLLGKGERITAAYVAYADFERGPAKIKMTLIKHGDGWQIYGLHINSRVFFEKLSKIICPESELLLQYPPALAD